MLILLKAIVFESNRVVSNVSSANCGASVDNSGSLKTFSILSTFNKLHG